MDKGMSSLLVVADDAMMRRQFEQDYSDRYEVHYANDYDSAIEALRLYEPPVVIQGLGLPPHADGVVEGFRTMHEILRLSSDTKIIVVTDVEGTEHALRAVSMGAYDFFQKPISARVLELFVARAFQMYDLEQQNRSLMSQKAEPLTGLVTRHPAMLNICSKLKKIAGVDMTCLLLGESGTGKEVLARGIHDLSSRKNEPFVVINCAAIPDTLMESELFGYERGAFTGAVKQSIGKIEAAHQGTLFLDELGDMPLNAQVKLLRFLQERVIERVGGRVEIPVDVRIVCATNKDLESMAGEGKFREDLYFRVSEMIVNIPPLRERDEDKLILSRHFLNQFVEEFSRDVVNFDESAIAAIDAYKWPGNVRELMNRIKNAVVLGEHKFITSVDLGLEDVGEPAFNLKHVRENAERTAIVKALSVCKGKITAAAKLLGVTRPTLYDLLKRHDIKNEHKIAEFDKNLAIQGHVQRRVPSEAEVESHRNEKVSRQIDLFATS
jgi:two-component system NtrC family response regulator